MRTSVPPIFSPSVSYHHNTTSGRKKPKLSKQSKDILKMSKPVKMARKSKFTEVFTRSPLQQLTREAKEIEKTFVTDQRGEKPKAQKKPPIIKTGDVRKKPVIVDTPLQMIPERAVYCSVGENEGADLERSNAIKRGVARPRPSGDRPRASHDLHRSNAIHVPSRSASMRVGDLHRSNAMRIPSTSSKNKQ